MSEHGKYLRESVLRKFISKPELPSVLILIVMVTITAILQKNFLR